MLDALDYLNQKDVNTISTHVLSGNDKVISFYKKFGFYPRTIVLKKENDRGIGTPIEILSQNSFYKNFITTSVTSSS